MPSPGDYSEFFSEQGVLRPDLPNLADPDADRLLGWDDSAGVYAFFSVGTNLSIDGTTINATGGGGGGTWGSITGTLSAQTDLQSALNLKAPLASPTFTGTLTAAAFTATGAVTLSPANLDVNIRPSGTGVLTIWPPTTPGFLDNMNIGEDQQGTGSFTTLAVGGKAITLAGNLTTTGAFNTTFAASASVTITLPGVSGTLATLAGTEALSNKTITASPISGSTGSFTTLTASSTVTLSPNGASVAISPNGTVTISPSGTITVAPGGDVSFNPTGTVLCSKTLNLRNGTTPVPQYIHGTYTDTSNYRRGRISNTTAGVLTISSEGLGTGATGNTLELATNGTTRVTISDSQVTAVKLVLTEGSGNGFQSGSGTGIWWTGGGAALASDRTIRPSTDGTSSSYDLGTSSQRWHQLFIHSDGIKIGNGTSGPTITATGTSPNESIVITPSGTGTVQLSGTTTADTVNATTLSVGAMSVKADVLEAPLFAADAGSTDTYVATLSPAITAYVTGAHYRFKANTANTGAATLNLNGLGAKTIVKVAGGITTALANNDIRAGQWVDVVYDGTNLQMQSTLGNAAAGGGSVATDAIFDAAGDLVVGTGADTAARLAVGGLGAKLTSDGSTPFWSTLSNTIEIKEEFSWPTASPPGDWDKSGTMGTAINEFGDGNHWGVIRFRSQAVAVSSVFTGSESFRLGAGTCYFEWIIKTPENNVGAAALSDATDDYALIIGLADTTGAFAQTDGVYFRYSHDINGGDWQGVCESNTTESVVDTNIAVAGATWYRLGVLVTNATSAQFYIDGVAVGAPVTTNIPNGAGRTLGPAWIWDRQAGTAERNTYIDAFHLVFKPTTPR